jgi:hypothetical protein
MTNASRRKFLVSAAALPIALSFASIFSTKAHAATGSIREIIGDVYINQVKINSATVIKNGDEIVVSKDGKLVFTMGQDAFLLRGGSTLQVYSEENDVAVSALRLVGGAVLGVFGKRSKTTRIYTSTATIGIRGTAVYAAVTPQQLYTCTCYGHTDLIVGLEKEEIIAKHHNAHVVTTGKSGGAQMKAFEVLDHNDDELRMLEALVGRKPLFDR